MTHTWSDPSLALLVVPVVSARIGLGDDCHSRKEPSDALLSLPSSMSSADRGRFWALCGAAPFCSLWSHAFTGGRILYG
ncbi:hypothetical protein GQ600_11183 [Phytophthora cactorum]|nr:hypothetical protein GQ600_11183 [Phytophthora cactorum]